MPTAQEIASGVGQFLNVPQLVGDARTVGAEFQSGVASFKYDARQDARTEVERLLPIAVLDAAYDLQSDFPDDAKEGGFRFNIFNGAERKLIESIRTNHRALNQALQASTEPNNPYGPSLLTTMYQKIDKLTLPLDKGLDIELRGTPGEALTVMIQIADEHGIELLPDDLRQTYKQIHADRDQLKTLLEVDTPGGGKRRDEIVREFEAAVRELSTPRRDPNNRKARPRPEALFDETNRIKANMLHYMDEYDANNDARADANHGEVNQAGLEMALATTGGVLRMLGFGFLADLGISAASNFDINVDISHLPEALQLFANNIINLALDNPVKALALLWGTTLLAVGLSKIATKGSTDAVQMVQQRLKMKFTRLEGMRKFRELRQDYINRGIMPGRRSRKPKAVGYTLGV